MASSQSESAGFWSTIVRRFKGDADGAPAPVFRLEDVRRAMLSQLSAEGAQRHPALAHRITGAKSAKTLWYQRPALMEALSEQYGEGDAHERMERLSAMFEGMLPKHMMPRAPRITNRRRSKK